MAKTRQTGPKTTAKTPNTPSSDLDMSKAHYHSAGFGILIDNHWWWTLRCRMVWVIGLGDDYNWAWRHKGKRWPRSWKHAKFGWPHSVINGKISNRFNYLFEHISNYPHQSQPSYLFPRCPHMIEKGVQYCAQFTKWYQHCWGCTNMYVHHSHPPEAHEAIKSLKKIIATSSKMLKYSMHHLTSVMHFQHLMGSCWTLYKYCWWHATLK